MSRLGTLLGFTAASVIMAAAGLPGAAALTFLVGLAAATAPRSILARPMYSGWGGPYFHSGPRLVVSGNPYRRSFMPGFGMFRSNRAVSMHLGRPAPMPRAHTTYSVRPIGRR
jgi:hypothetical protein